MMHFSPKRKKVMRPAQTGGTVDRLLIAQLYSISKYARKLLATTVLGVLFFLATTYVGSFFIQNDYKDQAVVQRLQNLSAQLLTHALFLRNHQQVFGAGQKAEDIDGVHDHGSAALRVIDEMKRSTVAAPVHTSLDRMTARLQEHLQNFDLLILEYREIGLGENEGLRGDLRKAAHIVEGYLNEDGLAEFMQIFLMARRYEKDFLLSQNERYLVEVARGIDEFESLVKAAPFKEATKATVYRIAEQYRDRFNLLASKTLLVRDKSAEIDRIYEDFSIVLGQVNDYVNGLTEGSRKASFKSLFQFKALLTAVSLFVLVISGFYGVALMRRITRALNA